MSSLVIVRGVVGKFYVGQCCRQRLNDFGGSMPEASADFLGEAKFWHLQVTSDSDTGHLHLHHIT